MYSQRATNGGTTMFARITSIITVLIGLILVNGPLKAEEKTEFVALDGIAYIVPTGSEIGEMRERCDTGAVPEVRQACRKKVGDMGVAWDYAVTYKKMGALADYIHDNAERDDDWNKMEVYARKALALQKEINNEYHLDW